MVSIKKWMMFDLIANIILAVALATYAVFVIKRLKIRLNIITRVKWIIALISVLMRLLLTVIEYVRDDYGLNTFKYYYLFAVDQTHFMIILTLFFTVIGSWQIMFSFSPE